MTGSLPALTMLGDQEPAPVLGIDLGTTNTIVAVFEEGQAKTLTANQRTRIPSVVSWTKEGTVVVGGDALARARVAPATTIYSSKRIIGRGRADLGSEAEKLPYPVVDAEDRPMALIQIEGKLVSPVEVAAHILSHARTHASISLGRPVSELNRCVITVPAYFDDVQRHATREAAKLAGLEVLRILNEPTAAALAYGLDQTQAHQVLVYDLGGGTFDASILRLEEGVFRVLSTAGNTHLGGDDFDQLLISVLAEELKEEKGVNLLADPGHRMALRMAAERCKRTLTEKPIAELAFNDPATGIAFRRSFSREEFEGLLTDHIQATLDCCQQALQDANVTIDEIDEVVLVGGSTRIPAVRKAVETCFQRKPHTALDPDRTVALGAAIQGGVLTGEAVGKLLFDVTPLSLGIETVGGAVSKLIHRNQSIPARAQEAFTTFVDGQTMVKIHVVQGEREMTEDCRSLGEFILKGIPPMPAGLPKIGVEFTLDADGILRVKAREERSQVVTEIEIIPKHGLTDEEVESMLKCAWEHAESDMDQRRVADLKTEIHTVLKAIRKNLDCAKSKLAPKDWKRLQDALDEAKDLDSIARPDALQGILDELGEASYPLAEHLMNNLARDTVQDKSIQEVLGDS